MEVILSDLSWHLSSIKEYCDTFHKEVESLFNNDGSVEFKEFMKFLYWYYKVPSITTNYYTALILVNGINNYLNSNEYRRL